MGRTQVFAVAILGAWLATTLCIWFAATKSFATVERVMKRADPQFMEATKHLSEASTRVVPRYMASEVNRTLFWGYGALQIALGVILFLLLWRQTPRNGVDIGVVATMLALSVILTFVITPLIISLVETRGHGNPGTWKPGDRHVFRGNGFGDLGLGIRTGEAVGSTQRRWVASAPRLPNQAS